ncbi:MAG: MutS-related protein [Gemmataceae bacterium]
MQAESQQLSEAIAAPSKEYARRLEERRTRSVRLSRQERLLGLTRLLVGLTGLLVLLLAFGAHWLSAWWLLPPIGIYSVLLFYHERLTRAWYRSKRAVVFYEDGVARLRDDWNGRGQSGSRFQDETHPYASDLDLFGTGSLFQLLCTARTRTGEDTLASWLLHAAEPAEIRARQSAVAELRPLLDLREDLALLGSDVPAGVDFNALAKWGAEPPLLTARWPRWAALLLGSLTTTALAGWLLTLFGLLDETTPFGRFFSEVRSLPFALLLAVQLCFAAWFFGRVQRVLAAVERRGRDLALLSNVLARLEKAEFTAPRLRELRSALDTPSYPPRAAGRVGGGGGRHVAPSERIAQLGNLLDLLNSRRNQLFMPFAYLLLWGTQMAHAIEGWRAVAGSAIARWLDVVGQFEALCALAAYAYENPNDPFPEIATDGGPCYDGKQLGHPLLPVSRCVRNDLRLTDGLRVLIVSGSNMSGKSTYLRTAGINAVLALAGAPVRAQRLRLSPLAVGATLRIQDSLQQGRSRFYAEILRVRQIVDLTRGPLPLLFLLDEIFAGTNSHDRRIGAEAIVRGLVESGALGLVTTHDLSLTHIADQLGSRAANVHFADHFENGEMKFDYRMQPGVVRHSNALALMRAVGLKV